MSGEESKGDISFIKSNRSDTSIILKNYSVISLCVSLYCLEIIWYILEGRYDRLGRIPSECLLAEPFRNISSNLKRHATSGAFLEIGSSFQPHLNGCVMNISNWYNYRLYSCNETFTVSLRRHRIITRAFFNLWCRSVT